MSVRDFTWEEAETLAGVENQPDLLLRAYEAVQQGKVIPSESLAGSLAPRIDMIRKGIQVKFPINDEISLPIGMSVVTGGAGSGKTKYVQTTVRPAIPESARGIMINIGEPGCPIPYHLISLLRCLEKEMTECEKNGEVGIAIIDSLLGAWSDPKVTKGFATGRGGSSLGVPVLLQILGQAAIARGYRIVVILHPLFADPEVIENGISGVSSFFLNLDNGGYIVRDYEQIPEEITSGTLSKIPYTRREKNMTDTNRTFPLMVQTIGDED